MNTILIAHVDGLAHVHPEDIVVILVGSVICAALFWVCGKFNTGK